MEKCKGRGFAEQETKERKMTPSRRSRGSRSTGYGTPVKEKIRRIEANIGLNMDGVGGRTGKVVKKKSVSGRVSDIKEQKFGEGGNHQTRIIDFYTRRSSQKSSVISTIKEGASIPCPLSGAQDPGGGFKSTSGMSPRSKPVGGKGRIKEVTKKKMVSILEMWKLGCGDTKGPTKETQGVKMERRGNGERKNQEVSRMTLSHPGDSTEKQAEKEEVR